MSRLPYALAPYVGAVADQVAEVLGVDLVGVFTTGSLALGDFRSYRSDVDLMAVVTGPVELSKRLELAERLDHRRLACPASGLEFVLYPATLVAQPTVEAGYLLNLNTGRALPARVSCDPGDGASFWYPIDRAIAYQSGEAVRGSSPQRVLAAVPPRALLPVVIASVAANARPGRRDMLDNAVLNACRALSFATDHHWYAKVPAAERTIGSAGRFAGLVREAIDSYRSGREPATRLSSSTVRDFLDHIVDRLHVAAGPDR